MPAPRTRTQTSSASASSRGSSASASLDKQGRVVFSTAAADVGQLIGQEGRACTACHGVSLAALDANVLAFRRGFVVVLSAAVLVLAALLFLFGRAEVVEPVAALLEGTRRVARATISTSRSACTRAASSGSSPAPSTR